MKPRMYVGKGAPSPPLTAAELEDYEERAAIMEYDGLLTHAEAEEAALECVLKARAGR